MAIRKHRNPLPHLTLLACLGVSACSGGIPGVYRIPIQQGNVITVEMLQELKLGMDKRKVKFILGTPLVTDVFHLDRWDYFYSYKPGTGDTVQQRASLFFENDRLVRVDADIDSNVDFHTVTHASEKVLIVPPKEKSGFFAALTPAFVTRDEEEQAQAAIARTLDTGFNEPQPGAAETRAAGEGDEVLDAALAAPAIIGPQLEDAPVPSETYAPNSSPGIDAAAAWSPEPAPSVEPISAETLSRSRFLEELFDDFGSTPEPRPQTAEAARTPDAGPEPVVIRRRDPSVPTRD
jgi:outer membrane protein assembly factor BamE